MSRERLILAGAALLIVLVVGAGFLGRKTEEKSLPLATTTPMTQTPQDLKIDDLAVGTGAEATAGATISVNYRGTLVDGSEFDSSYKRNQPFQFVLGAGEVIQGWDQGFVGMKVGGKRRLTIPPSLGYGDRPAGAIPPNSTFIFEVELLSVSR